MADRPARRLIGLDSTQVSARAERLVKRFHDTTASVTAAIKASMLDEPVHKGGEGVLLMNTAPNGYWRESLFRLEGRGRQPPLPMLAYFCWCTAVTAVNVYEDARTNGDESPLVIDPWVLQQVGTALFLLLVFRTTAAYERWWEGRRKWGDIIVHSRSLARQAGAYIDDQELAKRVIRLTIAYSAALKRQLRGERELPELAAILSAEDLEGVLAANHMTLHIACSISATVAAARAEGFINSIELVRLDESLTVLMDATGACERINSTKMPFAYIAHLRLFLAIWLLCLPFAMFSFLHWATMPACMVTAYALVGLETIGVEIEGPFGNEWNDLPLDTYTDSVIRPNLLQVLSYCSLPESGVGSRSATPLPQPMPSQGEPAQGAEAEPSNKSAPPQPARAQHFRPIPHRGIVAPMAAVAPTSLSPTPNPKAQRATPTGTYLQMAPDSAPSSPTLSPLPKRSSANDAMLAELQNAGNGGRKLIGRDGRMFRSSGSFVESFNLSSHGLARTQSEEARRERSSSTSSAPPKKVLQRASSDRAISKP